MCWQPIIRARSESRRTRARRTTVADAAATSHGQAFIWTLGISLVGLALLAMPHLYGLWGEDIGFAASFVGVLLVVSGTIAAGLFAGAVRRLERLLSGQERLVRWTYPADVWLAFVVEEQARQQQDNRATLILVTVLMLLAAGGMLLFMEDRAAALTAAGILVGILALVVIAAVTAPLLVARRLRRGPFEVQIGPRALYRGGQSHVWGGLLGRFEDARVESGRTPVLILCYSVLQVTGGRSLAFYRRYERVAVPIPPGQDAEAQRVMAALSAAA